MPASHAPSLISSTSPTSLTNSMSSSWSDILAEANAHPDFQSILQFLAQARQAGKVIYPAADAMFSAFQETPYATVKVVILGQDPYHGPDQAHGLAFSVQPGIKLPPSLKNIFQELKTDVNLPIPTHGYLKKWANQGVLLLNTALSVEQGQPQSHAKIGWSTFTDLVIRKLNDHPMPLVFLLWGAHAQKKGECIDGTKHHLLTAAHPSPLSVHRGFYGCRHFSKANAFLQSIGRDPIDWAL